MFYLRYKKQIIIGIITFFVIVGIFVGAMLHIKEKAVTGINDAITNIKLDEINKNKTKKAQTDEGGVDLLEKKQEKGEGAYAEDVKRVDKQKQLKKDKKIKTTIYNDVNVRSAIDVMPSKAKAANITNKDKINIFIAVNSLDPNKLKSLNSFLKKAKFMIGSKYNFILVQSKKLDKNKACLYGYKQSSFKKKIGPFNRDIEIIYNELISYFNKKKEHTDDKLFIFNNNDLNLNCNSIEGIKANIKNIKTTNHNIIIFDNNKRKELEKKFFYNLSVLTGVTNVTYDSDLDFRNKLNDYIYPLEDKIELTNSKSDIKINTYISFYDKEGKEYQGELTILKKQSGIFKPIKREIVKKVYKGKLDAGIYKFEAYDPITKIYLETEPYTINKVSKFEYKFVFRKTRLIIRIVDENKKPILADIYIKGIQRKDIYINKFSNKSNLILSLKPGDYKVNIKTKNNFIFNDEFKINGENTINKEYITIKQKVKVHVVNQNNETLKNTLITILKDGELYDTKRGNDITFKLQLGKYTIKAIDTTSGDMVSKYFEITKIPSSMTATKIITLTFTAYPIKIDLGRKGYIVKLYNSKSLMKHLKRFSGTGIKTLNLSKGTYVLKVYDKNTNKELWKQRFTVDGFLDRTIKIKKPDDI